MKGQRTLFDVATGRSPHSSGAGSERGRSEDGDVLIRRGAVVLSCRRVLARRRTGQARATLVCLACALASFGCGHDTGEEVERQCTLRAFAYCDRFQVCAPAEFARHYRSTDDCEWDVTSGGEACSRDKYQCPGNGYQVLDPGCPGQIATQPCDAFSGEGDVLPPGCTAVCP